ncbi:MAG: Maf family nucleotide pyrophosphatase [Microscillaceae bacterium]|nr:Maf family nucleotide pyrophosphatase [Microscillaceae bacterium]MDW8459968.1 Maf family nucleotide pyrophosphatase [Cytophagales bacterium]
MKVILASQSPRRQEILRKIGIEFVVKTKNIPEDYPAEMPVEYVPIYLAQKKAAALSNEISAEELVIAADTVVILENSVFGKDPTILGKPQDLTEAKQMLRALSGRSHTVITGVCINHQGHLHTFSEKTIVFFKELTEQDIHYYVRKYKPLDKAGAYGAQEFIGMIGIERIKGCFYNVMGLPAAKLYEELKKYQLLENCVQ